MRNRTATQPDPRKSLLAVLALILIGGGCSDRAAPVPSAKQAAVVESMDVVDRHEVGTICSGEWLKHSFTFRNRTTGELRIASDDDIVTGCGCTSLIPTKRVLQPGESTDVAIAIDTQGRAEQLSFRGTIRWSGAGEPITHSMIVHGNAEALLTLSNAILTFKSGDKAKSVEVTGNRFATYKNWKVVTSGTAVAQAKLEVIDERTARIDVTPDQTGNLEVVTSTVSVTADIASCQCELPLQQADISFSVRRVQEVELSIQPSELILKFDPDSQTAKASLMVRGKELSAKKLHIDGGPHEVKWQLHAPSGMNGTLRLTIRKRPDQPLPKALTITVDDDSRFTVPLIVQP